ncbi:MAG: hypothetical protein QMD46_12080 [Methanomicrobiales archaeon]|nr:hypothetical protein [Methanomicrobiales archaeon]MDI6876899.1 hypothetical protein [Methanomicrobiales archaeon]
MERLIGEVTHYFPRIGVAAVRLDDDLSAGDAVIVRGARTNFSQTVSSLQLEHRTVSRGLKGQEIGMKVDQRVHTGDRIYRLL